MAAVSASGTRQYALGGGLLHVVERLDGTTQSREGRCQVGHGAVWTVRSLRSVEHCAGRCQ
jgi:hypothetical protein